MLSGLQVILYVTFILLVLAGMISRSVVNLSNFHRIVTTETFAKLKRQNESIIMVAECVICTSLGVLFVS